MGTTTLVIRRANRLRSGVEQRAFPRYPTDRAARCWLSLRAMGPGAKAKVTDISQAGVGLELTQAFKPGETILIEVEAVGSLRGQPREAEIRWVHSPGDGSYRLGCTWTHRLTYAEIQKLIQIRSLGR